MLNEKGIDKTSLSAETQIPKGSNQGKIFASGNVIDDIKDIANKGRYYLAKIIDQDGRVTDTVLIDKLSRSIHFPKTTTK